MLPLIASAGKGDLTRGLVLHGLYYYLPLSSLPFSSSPPLLPSSSPSWSLADAIEVPKEYTGPRNDNDKERGSGRRDLRVLPRWPVYVCVCVCACVGVRERGLRARAARGPVQCGAAFYPSWAVVVTFGSVTFGSATTHTSIHTCACGMSVASARCGHDGFARAAGGSVWP